MTDQQLAETLPCGICGQPRTVHEWLDVTAWGDPRPVYTPGRIGPCPTPRCGQVCRICHREPGDVHGPDCGPLMRDKLNRPHIVDRSDCR